MTPEQRQQIETQINNDFVELQKKLNDLKTEVQSESDTSKKQEKQQTIQEMETELASIQSLIDTLSSLQEQDLQSLKERLEQTKQLYNETRWETADLLNERWTTPTTYELLKDSETYNRLITIISSNPKEFKKLPWDSAEAKLEYIFSKIRNWIVLFLKNKLWNSERYNDIINNTIAPALEYNLLELLRDQWNENNVSMLKWMDKISWENFTKLVSWVWKFAKSATWSYDKFNSRMNAIDYLSIHNGVLLHPEKSAVLTNPLEFQKYLNDSLFSSNTFSPYASIDRNIFKVEDTQTFEFWMSLEDKQKILGEIWNIQVVNNPKTTALIAGMIDKPEQFLKSTSGLQNTANHLLDSLDGVSSVTKLFWLDIIGEVTKVPEKRSFWYKIMDFVCKLIWITWWLEWIVRRWRLDRLNLTDEKNDNISQIFNKYRELVWEGTSLSITDEASCKTALADFALNDYEHKPSSTKWDYLRDMIAENLNVSLLSTTVVQQTLWDDFIKKETMVVNWKKQEKISVNESKFTDEIKKEFAHRHVSNMKTHLESNYNDLKDFYTNIKNTDDIAICMTASLYADKNDVIEWVKAKVFLPENYMTSVTLTGEQSSENGSWNNSWRENLDSRESSDRQTITEQRIYDKSKEYWITDNRQIAYVLSTIKWESWFKNQKEIWWENRDYWQIDSVTWKAYYGRWFIQITHKYNYDKYTKIIQDSWKNFRGNDWHIINCRDIDLVNDPDIILESNELAVFIAIDWMKNWWPDRIETKKLDYYINDDKVDYYNARQIINWMSSSPQKYADTAKEYLAKLWNWNLEDSIDTDEILVWPKLLAHNKDEIWWLWNSIMTGFQWYRNKLKFPHMDWVESKTTQNHPNRFNSQLDVQWYKVENPNIKSFMFYFWANTRDNRQTLSDIQQWSERLEEEWIQPVLCTCIWEDKHERLKNLNKSLIDLWKEKNRPVFDFVKLYNNWDIAMWWGTSPHPTSAWYSTMARVIEDQFA